MRYWRVPMLCCCGLSVGACVSPQSRQMIGPLARGEDGESTATAQAGVANANDLIDFVTDLRLDSDPAVMIAVLVAVVLLQGVTNIALMVLLWWVALFSHRREVLRLEGGGRTK